MMYTGFIVMELTNKPGTKASLGGHSPILCTVSNINQATEAQCQDPYHQTSSSSLSPDKEVNHFYTLRTEHKKNNDQGINLFLLIILVQK